MHSFSAFANRLLLSSTLTITFIITNSADTLVLTH